MTRPLVKIWGKRLVDARHLHERLGSKKDSSNWIEYKIKQGGFVEGQDFLTQMLKTPSSKGGRPWTEYLLSIDTLKYICKIGDTARGNQI